MATAPHSPLLPENVNELSATFVPAQSRRRDINQLYAAIGVKSHGTITFSDNRSNRANFIRVPPDASVAHVKELLNQQWCDGRPSLVISVTGGASEYDMKPKLLRAFRRGLLKVARTTGAWIITGGMNTGLMKLVGEIVQMNPDRSRPIHLIGIVTWGCVSGFQQLDVHGANVHYVQPRSDRRGEAPLEPNHTEFIFIDDGSERRYGGEINFRAKLGQAISGGFFASETTATSTNASLQGTASLRPEHLDPVPVVLVVVEGGPNTVRTVHEAVVQNNIPAVFLEGTGRCCDLFAKACRLYNEYRPKTDPTSEPPTNAEQNNLATVNEELKNKLREGLKDELRAIGGVISVPNTDKPPAATTDHHKRVDTTDYFELVYECVHTRPNFLNVITLDSRNPVEPDVDLVILQAVLKATSGNDIGKTNIQRKREQLHLALEWNRVDIAKDYIMRDERDWKIIDLNDLFSLALGRNQTAFVKFFLDHSFPLTDLFQNNDKLLALYRNYMTETHHLTEVSSEPLQTIYREIIQPLIGDFFDVNAALASTELTSNHELIDENEEERCLCCVPRIYHSPSVNDHGENVQSEASTGYTGGLIDVDKELFLWSVITGRREFALLFWARGKNKICAALIATSLFKKHARKNNDYSYYQSADEFETLAVQILDKFYQANPHTCIKAIIRQIPAYGKVTWLELAVAAEAKQFIAQKAVQDVLNKIWFGYIDQRVSVSTIVFSTVMLWFSGFLRYHNELVKTNDETTFLDDSLHSQTSQGKRTVNGTRTKVYQYFGNIMTFMRAPYVKYLYNLYFHVIFLLLFSYVILCDFFPLYDFPSDTCAPSKKAIENGNDASIPITDRTSIRDKHPTNTSTSYGFEKHTRPATTELVLVVWVLTLLCEEIRQLVSTEAQLKRNAVRAYFKKSWNKVDVLAIILFFIGFALRFLPTAECFCAARIILSIDLAIWYIRSLSMFTALKRLGPKLVMIREMVHDLKFFVLLLIVFMLAYGVSSYSLIHGVQNFSWHLPRIIVNHVFWQIFGEFSTLETLANNYKANGYVAFFLLVAYMIVVSILLIDLLIAMFSNTFNRLQTDADRISKDQRYLLVSEYVSRPTLSPPLIFFSHLWRLSIYILARCIKLKCIQHIWKSHLRLSKYKILLDEKTTTHIEIAEDAFGDEIYYNYLEPVVHSPPPQETVLNKIERLENHVQLMSVQLTQILENQKVSMNASRQRVSDPEEPYMSLV